MREKIKGLLVKALRFILNPRLLLCFGIAWMITNGWSYLMLAVGTWLGVPWMIAVASAYLAILWLPSPEKILTCAIAILLLRLLFPFFYRARQRRRKVFVSTAYLGQFFYLFLRRAQNAFRIFPHLFQKLRDKSVAVFDKRVQQMYLSDFLIAVFTR